MNYKIKYLKYKNKYFGLKKILNLKNQKGGNNEFESVYTIQFTYVILKVAEKVGETKKIQNLISSIKFGENIPDKESIKLDLIFEHYLKPTQKIVFVTNIQNILTTFDSRLLNFVLLRLNFKIELSKLLDGDLTHKSIENKELQPFLIKYLTTLKKKYSDFLKSNNLEDEETITHLEDFINKFKKIEIKEILNLKKYIC